MFPYKTLYILALVAITNAVPITVHNYAFVAVSSCLLRSDRLIRVAQPDAHFPARMRRQGFAVALCHSH